MKLTIGFAMFGDPDGFWFTTNAWKLYQQEEIDEFIVVNNEKNNPLNDQMHAMCNDMGIRYIEYFDVIGPALAKEEVINNATGDYVLLLDSHCLLVPGSLKKVKQFFTENPDFDGLLHGIITVNAGNHGLYIYKGLPYWHKENFGKVQYSHFDKEMDPFEIEIGMMGCVAFKRNTWLGFNKNFMGYGGEEGYIHIKYQQQNRKVLVHPGLRCVHRYMRYRVPFPLSQIAKVRNYMLGFKELDRYDLICRMRKHFVDRHPEMLPDGQFTEPALNAMPAETFDRLEQDPTSVIPPMGPEVQNALCIPAS